MRSEGFWKTMASVFPDEHVVAHPRLVLELQRLRGLQDLGDLFLREVGERDEILPVHDRCLPKNPARFPRRAHSAR